MSDVLSITVPCLIDPHVHFREAEKKTMKPLIKNAINGGARVFGAMPNTKDGLLTALDVKSYTNLAKSCVPKNVHVDFIPIVMINEKTTPAMLNECARLGIMDGKVYPLDRTTQSHYGVRDYLDIVPPVRHMGKLGMRCHMHPEHPWMLIQNRDAEYQFLPIMDMFIRKTETTLIWEHGTDGRCVPYWKQMAKTGRFYLTLTPHHLATSEDPSYGDVGTICKPSIKTLWDQLALLDLVARDYPWVMAGSDKAPHDVTKKHVVGKGCACGAYHGDFTLALYAHALNDLLLTPSGIQVFANFIHHNARKLYNLPEFSEMVTLLCKPFRIPMNYNIGDWTVEPFWAGREIMWSIAA